MTQSLTDALVIKTVTKPETVAVNNSEEEEDKKFNEQLRQSSPRM